MMAQIDNILGSVLNLARILTPVLPQIGGAAAVATALAKLIQDAKASAGPQHEATVAELTTLESQVTAHAQQVFDQLGDDPAPGNPTP
jgi:hypothetical protein